MINYGIAETLGSESPLFVNETLNGDYDGPFVSDLFIDSITIGHSAVAVLEHINSDTSLLGINQSVDLEYGKLINQSLLIGQEVLVTGSFSWNIDQTVAISHVNTLALDVKEEDSGTSGFGQSAICLVVRNITVPQEAGITSTVAVKRGYQRAGTSTLKMSNRVTTNASMIITSDIKAFSQAVVVECSKPNNSGLRIANTVMSSASVFSRFSYKRIRIRQNVVAYTQTSSGDLGTIIGEVVSIIPIVGPIILIDPETGIVETITTTTSTTGVTTTTTTITTDSGVTTTSSTVTGTGTGTGAGKHRMRYNQDYE
jgi:hypothetical protein